MTLSEYPCFQTASPLAKYAGGNWKLETGNCRALHGRGDAPTVSRATHPSKPEPYYPPRPEASRCVCSFPVHTFAKLRRLRAKSSFQNRKLGPSGSTEFPEGSNSRFQIPGVECGPRSRIQILKRALRARRVDQNTDSKFQRRALAHLQVRENTSGGVSKEFPQGGSRIQREG